MMAKQIFTYGSVSESLTLDASSIARRPSLSASSFLPKPASISPSSESRAYIIRVTTDLFLLLCACPHKRSACRSFVSFQTSDYTHPKVAAKLTRKGPLERILLGSATASAAGGVPVAIVQSKSVALARHKWIFLPIQGSLVRIFSISARKGPVSARRC